jgi:hypothetical protein
MAAPSPEKQIAGFMARYEPGVVRVAKGARTRLRALLPGAVEIVYDNYNALAIGFGPSERASEAIVSIALYPRWVSLFLLRGKGLPDPEGLLRGSGKQVRHIVLEEAAVLDRAPVKALIRAAVATAPVAIPRGVKRRVVVRSVSAKQRPRRPAEARRGR